MTPARRQAHTAEPWTTDIPFENQTINGADGYLVADCAIYARHRPAKICTANAKRIVECVNGAAGLNPAGYRACVEALKAAQDELESFKRSCADDEWQTYGMQPTLTKVIAALRLARGLQKEGS